MPLPWGGSPAHQSRDGHSAGQQVSALPAPLRIAFGIALQGSADCEVQPLES